MQKRIPPNQLPLFDSTDQQFSDIKENDDWLSDYLAAANLSEFQNDVEAWAIEGSSAKLSYLSHGFFRYFGKFPPPVAEKFLSALHEPKYGPVIDPMVGSGTTLVEALLMGRDAIGLDVNPMSVVVSKVKTTPIRKSTILATLEEFSAHVQVQPSGATFQEYIPADRQLNHWFFEETQEKLAWVRLFIENRIENQDVRDLFRVALAGNIRRFSRASNSLGRMFIDRSIEPQDVYRLMQKKISEMANVVEQLFAFKSKIQVREHDAQTPLDVPCTNLVICHPPYFNLYKYSSIYKYEMLWSGFENRPIRRSEIREGFKLGKESLVHGYVEDLGKVITNIEEVLVPGGWCVLMMGDTVIHNERVNTTALMCEFIRNNLRSLELDRLIIRQPKFTEASYAAAQRRDKDQVGVKLQDHLIVLRKTS